MAVPETVVTNDDLTSSLDTSDEWIRAHTGIRERRFLEAGLTTSDLCTRAATLALEASGVDAADLDAIVLATVTPDQPLPSTALVVKQAIGAHRAVPLDLNQAACAGGVLGILLGAHLLQNEHWRHVLVIGGETLSRLTDPLDRTTRVFFGDAAGAVVLGPTAPGYGILSWDTGSALSYSVEVPAGGARTPTTEATVAARQQFLQMDGRVVWREATRRLPESIGHAVRRAGLSVADIRHFVIHQANYNIIESVLRDLGVDPGRAGITIDRFGNTGAATVFTVLHGLWRSDDLRRGDPVVISGIGAGYLWGSLCLRHH